MPDARDRGICVMTRTPAPEIAHHSSLALKLMNPRRWGAHLDLSGRDSPQRGSPTKVGIALSRGRGVLVAGWSGAPPAATEARGPAGPG